LGIGDGGIGDWAQSPIPNPQSPIPNPQSPYENKLKLKIIFNEEILKKAKKEISFIRKKMNHVNF